MPQIMPITDLRKTNEISDICHKSQEPIFVTKNGYGDLVVMSIEAYERLITDTQIDAAIAEAETEMEGGAVLMDAREALSGLRRRTVWRQVFSVWKNIHTAARSEKLADMQTAVTVN